MTPQFPVQLPSGEFAELIPGECIRTHVGDIHLPGFDVLYLDITNVQVFKIAGQAQVEAWDTRRGTWKWEQATGWQHVSQHAPGIYPVIFDARGIVTIATEAGNGSQGWRYVAEDARLVTGDATLNAPRWNEAGRTPRVEKLWEFSYLGGVFIGQGETGCDVLIDGTRRRLLNGDTRNIRVKYDGERWGVSLMRFREGDSFRKVFTRAELEALPITQNDVVITQPPETPEIPMSVPDRSAEAAAFLAPRLKYFPGDKARTSEATFAAVNALCLDFRRTDPRWFLLVKEAGQANVRLRGVDVLLYQLDAETAQVVDVVGDGDGHDGPPRPSWEPKDIRPIHQAKHPFGDVVKPPETPEPPSSLNIGPAVQALIDAAVTAAEKRLTARIEALETPPAPLSGRFTATIQSANGRYLRHDWADDLPRFDRDTAGSGERYTVTLEPIE